MTMNNFWRLGGLIYCVSLRLTKPSTLSGHYNRRRVRTPRKFMTDFQLSQTFLLLRPLSNNVVGRRKPEQSKYFFVFFFPPVLTYPLRLFSFLLLHRTEALSTLFRCLTSEHPGVRKVRLEGWRYFEAHSLMADAHDVWRVPCDACRVSGDACRACCVVLCCAVLLVILLREGSGNILRDAWIICLVELNTWTKGAKLLD